MALQAGLVRELPFMVDGWRKGQIFDGLMLWLDIPYRQIADMHEKYPQIVIELPKR